MPKTDIQTTYLYNKEVRVDFYPHSHRYKINNEIITSVTAATGVIDKSGPLLTWAARLAEAELLEALDNHGRITAENISASCSAYRRVRDAAADLGTMVHNICEQHVQALIAGEALPDIPEDDRVANGYYAFLRWIKDHDVQFLAAEKMIYSRQHHYVGRYDIKAIVNGELCICDIKTGKYVYEEHDFQLSAYQAAEAEETGEQFGGRWLLRCDKESGLVEARRFTPEAFEDSFKVFLAALTIKNHLKTIQKYQ